MKILFKRTDKAFLPEIDAYIKYFNNTEIFNAYDSSKLKNDYDINDFDVIWEFKGFGGEKNKKKIIVHEYASLSTGSMPKLKNFIKAKFNPKPDLRVFLNENVKNGFKFADGIDYCYRDMGIDERFLNYKIGIVDKEYEFVYIGVVSRERGIDKLLEKFSRNPIGKILLIGNVDDEIYKKYKKYKDIMFTGKVAYLEVPEIASKAIYGINFIPDRYPYNLQTSTKLLEYLALGLKVITTDYKWVRDFEIKYECSFYKIKEHNFELSIRELEKFNFAVNGFNPQEFLWENIIKKSGVEEKLLNLVKR